MKLIVLSRKKAEQFTFNDRYAVISISDTDPANIPDHPERVGLLRLYFDDVDNSKQNGQLMTVRDAEQVANFVRNLVNLWGNEIVLMVHCFGGISRSSGCAAAISKFFNGTDLWLFEPPFYPNMHVYSLVLQKLQELYGTQFFGDINEKT